MVKLALSGWDGILAVLRWTNAGVLAFMMLTVSYDAIMRYLFSAPTSWSLEVNSFLLVYLAVVGAGEAQRHDAHIRITFFTQRLSLRTKAVIGTVIGLLGMLFCGIMVWRGWLMASQAWEYGERVSSAFGTPIAIPYALIPLGFGALFLQFVIEVLSNGGRVITPDAR